MAAQSTSAKANSVFIPFLPRGTLRLTIPFDIGAELLLSWPAKLEERRHAYASVGLCFPDDARFGAGAHHPRRPAVGRGHNLHLRHSGRCDPLTVSPLPAAAIGRGGQTAYRLESRRARRAPRRSACRGSRRPPSTRSSPSQWRSSPRRGSPPG